MGVIIISKTDRITVRTSNDSYTYDSSSAIIKPYATTSITTGTITFNDSIVAQSATIEERLRKLEESRAKIWYTELQCKNCGAPLQQRIDDHIVKCKYCKTAYVIGQYLINDAGREI